ncbi:unnamed protein product, partial [Linum tenue]
LQAGPYDNLKEVALKILQNDVCTVPIIHSSSDDGSFPQLLHLASLSGILKCIFRYFRHVSGSLPVLQLPICSIPLGTWVPKIGESNGRPLAMLRPSASLSAALNLLIHAQVSSIPIVDDNDSLLDIYCRSDITALAKDRVYTHINLNEMTIHQALQLGQDSFYPYELRSQRCQMCLRSDSLFKVMERFGNPGVRQVIIVEAGSKRVEGIVTLSDIFNGGTGSSTQGVLDYNRAISARQLPWLLNPNVLRVSAGLLTLFSGNTCWRKSSHERGRQRDLIRGVYAMLIAKVV